MRIVLDENVCVPLAYELSKQGHDVISIAEKATKGMVDVDVWDLACREDALVVTRDHHFTNRVRYDPSLCLGIIFVKHGNLTIWQETTLVADFIESHSLEDYCGKLVSLAPGVISLR